MSVPVSPTPEPRESPWVELGVSEHGTSVFFAPVGTTETPPSSRLYVPPAWTEEKP